MSMGSGKLKRLPRKVREELDQRLIDGNFTDYRGLAEWLGEQGCKISPAGVHRYGQRLEHRLEALKLATAQANAVVNQTQNDDNKMTEALLRLVQHNLFEVLIELEPSEVRGPNLHAIARSVANMGRAMIAHQRFASQLRQEIAARAADAEEKVVSKIRAEGSAGLSREAEAEIRRVLMSIVE